MLCGLYHKANKYLTEDTMIFPCGVSRSGSTLLAIVLDSHSQVSLGRKKRRERRCIDLK